ncbi:DUF2634 domain-containing protein [Cytobacillus praedii]|uniref:DUF2634 domain-containing protein n=1 Tax=Cytobacillus praedii TaxID=1742358 RepID=A0A4R1APV4_9BACI|nr:DUF2634 domain-containing protein [Cytobacillus praedii]TCJ01486.1 DUF2634 domain-containing protein [Cytobacillus praedii]
MVLPTGDFIVTEDVEVIDPLTLPTKTYRLDFEKGRCAGMIDDIEALKQWIFKALSTIRFKHIIYSDEYGFEEMIGKEKIYVKAELPRRIKETLFVNERITAIEDMTMVFEGDQCTSEFTCISVYGKFPMEVDINV